MAKQKICCPECGSQVKVWADLDAEASWLVTANGKLVNQEIKNNYQTDGRSGVECTNCDWKLYATEDDIPEPFTELVELAFEKQDSIIYLNKKS
jgi:hypothetical protein